MALIDNLVSYYKLDEASGNALDAHGPNTANNVGTVAFSAGKINNGAAFDGSNRTLRLSTATGIAGNTQGTVAAWVKANGVDASGPPIFAVGENDNDSTLSIWWLRIYNDTGNNRLQVFYREGNNAIRGSTNISTGTWYHVAVTSAGSSWKLYVNGAEETPTVVSGSNSGQWWGSLTGTPLNYEIGRITRGTGNIGLANATIDELGIWSRSLSGSEISELYNAGSGLAYPFSGGSYINHNDILVRHLWGSAV